MDKFSDRWELIYLKPKTWKRKNSSIIPIVLRVIRFKRGIYRWELYIQGTQEISEKPISSKIKAMAEAEKIYNLKLVTLRLQGRL